MIKEILLENYLNNILKSYFNIMYYIGYLSSESFPYSEETIRHILNHSQKRNSELKITGILVYIEGTIIQILEGKKEDVITIFEKIHSDVRHTGVTKIIEGMHEKRVFPNWSMGFKSVKKEDCNSINNYINFSKNSCYDGLEISSNQHHPIYVFLKSFYMGDI